jgi:hypothetical protein
MVAVGCGGWPCDVALGAVVEPAVAHPDTIPVTIAATSVRLAAGAIMKRLIVSSVRLGVIE